MVEFATKHLPQKPDVTAPDGSDVRILLELKNGGMAHFELAPGKISIAVAHRTVEEIWYIISGQGEMWRKQGNREEIASLAPGVTLTIPQGTHFQFRAHNSEPLCAIAITMPPWPGPDEAYRVQGKWKPRT